MRVSMAVIAVGLVVASLPLAWNALPERYADVAAVVTNLGDLIKPPYEMTKADRLLFSGRVDLWSIYLYNYFNASEFHQIFGLGPDSHQGIIRHQAHNSLIAYLYEQGLIGLVLLSFHFVYYMVVIDRREGAEHVVKLLTGHGGFILFNMTSNGLWSIESFIQYGLLIALTLEPGIRKAVEREATEGARRRAALTAASRTPARRGVSPRPSPPYAGTRGRPAHRMTAPQPDA
jgi:hypothetical protein